MSRTFLRGVLLGAILGAIAALTPAALLSQELRLKDILRSPQGVENMTSFMGVINPNGVPQPPPSLSVRMEMLRFRGDSNKIYPLDGLHCRTCVFEDVTFEYSGGNFYFDDVAFINTNRIIFKGAAANTIAALALAQWLQTKEPDPTPKPKTYIAKIETPKTVTWGTQN